MLQPLLLTGFMATGKSTVGRRVAALAGHRFVDLDAQIEAAEGQPIAEIFRTKGEAHFRTLERAALLQLLSAQDAPVVALGGGALLHRETRLHALERAVVISLCASPEELSQRILRAGSTRPLLAATGSTENIEILLNQRQSSYQEAHAQLQTDRLSIEEAAAQALGVWKSNPIAVAAGPSSYAVDIGAGLSHEWLAKVLHGVSSVVLVSDQTVSGLYGSEVQRRVEQLGARCLCVTLPPGEEHKNPQSLLAIWRQCLAGGVDRKSLFIGLGGGVVTDITGFAAATWMRGAAWVAMPTTLLSMVDASVGGKTAVDLDEAKNAVGAFWQPKAVLCDIARLHTEPVRGFNSALAEVVKTALIGDPELFDLLENRADAVLAREPEIVEQLVRRCVAVKASVVSRDERESGLRASLNLGHTLGHALEAYGGYGKLTHGEAVSLGLVAAIRLGEQLNVTSAALAKRVVSVLERLGLPVNPAQQGLADAAKLIAHDKKRSGADVRFVLVSDIGHVVLRSIPVLDLQAYAEQLH